MTIHRRLGSVVCILAVAASGCAYDWPTPGERFARSVSEYMEMRARAVQRIGAIPVTANSVALDRRVDRLTSYLQQLRQGLKQGVFFSREVTSDFRRRIATRLSSADGRQIVAAIADVQPRALHPVVNGIYPPKEPRGTIPPQLITALPHLPPELAYRFVGRELLLLDRDTGLILDLMPEALPGRE
jgi:hypothetical protein